MSTSGAPVGNPTKTSRAASLSLGFGIAAVVCVAMGWALGLKHDDIMIQYCLEMGSAFDEWVPGGLFSAAFFISLAAIVAGIKARRSIRRLPGALTGSARAVAGTWTGALGILVIVVTIVFSQKIPSPFSNPAVVAGNGQAVGTLRSINTSEVTYAATYSTGFSLTLEQLGGTASPNTPDQAGLIAPKVAAGTSGRVYKMTYVSHRNAETGNIESYEVNADPVCPGRKYHYFTDQTGIIRQTDENRRATAKDSPLAG